MTDAEIQREFAWYIMDKEARRDPKGRLKVYWLPKGDGGGSYEVAGINVRYHPKMARRLKGLIEKRRFAQAEKEATDYIEKYTGAVDEWHPDERVEGYLRSVAFNRGAGGAAWILQYALKYAFYPSLYEGRLDRKVGPLTRDASYRADADTLLDALPAARTVYERTAIPGVKGRRTESSKFWHGLFRRFVNDMTFARSLKPEDID